MSRGLDFTSLTRAEQVVLASGALLLVDGMLPWWYRVVTPERAFSYNAGLTVWGIVVTGAGAIAAIAVLLRTAIWPEPAPSKDGLLYASLGALATLSCALEIARNDTRWLGLYIALALGIALTAAGLRRRVRRRAGWT